MTIVSVGVRLMDPPGIDLSVLRQMPGYSWSAVQRVDPPSGPSGNRRLVMPVFSSSGSSWIALVLVSPHGKVIGVSAKGRYPTSGVATSDSLKVASLLLRDATGGGRVSLRSNRPRGQATGSALFAGRDILAGVGSWLFQFRDHGVLVSMQGSNPDIPPPSVPPTGLCNIRDVERKLARKVVWKPRSTQRRAFFSGAVSAGWVRLTTGAWLYCYGGMFAEQQYCGTWFAGSTHGGGTHKIVNALTGDEISYLDIWR